MFHIALVSRFHNHAKENRYVDQLKNFPDAVITCVWDEDPVIGQAWAEELSTEFEPTLDSLLARNDVDGIILTSSTDKHKEYIIKAAKAGKHVFTEKALAMNYAEALEIEQAVNDAGIQLGIVFPRRGVKEYNWAKQLVDEGAFGDICFVRIRVAVTNLANLKEEWYMPENQGGGGGAIRDLTCHTLDVACWLLGEPESIQVTRGYTGKHFCEDTGICTLRFKNGTLVTLDSTYSAPLSDNWYTLEIYGSKMAYITGTHEVTIIRADGTQTVIPVCDVPHPGRPLPIKQWINACCGKGENICTVEAGVLVNKILDAVEIADKEQRTVMI